MISLNILRPMVMMAIVLAFTVVLLGAYTRLTDAGLGCPDWPGCYGQMVPVKANMPLSSQAKVETRKAWTEMVHRYAAGTLGLLIVFFAVLGRRWLLPRMLFGLLIFQALLGMWTVTLKLLPIVVMGHLLGGFLLLSGLCYWRWQLGAVDRPPQGLASLDKHWCRWVYLGLLIVFCQIALGGWVSSNYAGIACIGFPRCNAQWLPSLHWSDAFQVLSSVGANHQGGLLQSEARTTIHWLHRVGAFITVFYISSLTIALVRRTLNTRLRQIAKFTLYLVLLQFMLGIMNVVFWLPLPIAVAHNGVAALLLMSMVSLLFIVKEGTAHAKHA